MCWSGPVFFSFANACIRTFLPEMSVSKINNSLNVFYFCHLS